MPELPEVEVITRALRPHLLGRQIIRVETLVDKLRRPLTLARAPELLNRKIVAVRRRAKYILVEFENLPKLLLLHLGMTGSFRLDAPGVEYRRHDRIIFHLDNGKTWRFHDPRRFGHAALYPLTEPGGLPDAMPPLAPEPLEDEFTQEWLEQVCRNRQKPVKNLLMDNALVAGVGNIYASETLSRAGIRPDTPAGKLTRPRLARLRRAIREVLAESIEAGGTTISDFQGVDGSEGLFRRQLRVYGKAGERCGECRRGVIRKLTMSGRATYFCPVCQRR